MAEQQQYNHGYLIPFAILVIAMAMIQSCSSLERIANRLDRIQMAIEQSK
jgi:hypothetical protein